MQNNKEIVIIISVVLFFTCRCKGQEYARFTEDSTVYINSIKWSFASDKFLESSYNTLNQICHYLKQKPETRLSINMYQKYESVYSVDYMNKRLLSIADFLSDCGIDKARIAMEGFDLLGENNHRPYFLLVKFHE